MAHAGMHTTSYTETEQPTHDVARTSVAHKKQNK